MTQIKFEYTIPAEPAHIMLTMPLVRKTLRAVQAQLLAREINGGGKKLTMETTTRPNSCGMAACIGGWTSLLLLGFDKTRDNRLETPADELFSALTRLDARYGHGRLYDLFHEFAATRNYDEPNVAATAIKRYLADKKPWPVGEMPGVMPYTKPARKRAAKKRTAKKRTAR